MSIMQRSCSTKSISWAECKVVAADESRLHELGRSLVQQQEYEAAMQSVRERYASIGDYILLTKFHLEQEIAEGKLAAKRESNSDQKCGDTKLSKTVLIPNDFPYNFTSDIKHFVLWKWGGGPLLKKEISNAEMHLRKQYGYAAIDSLNFTSPPALKSIPELEHAHILLRLSEEEILQKSTSSIASHHEELLIAPDDAGITLAAQRLTGGGLVAFPTETVYGLGASALQEDAVLSIFAAKGRPLTDPLIVHVHELQAARPLVDLTAEEWNVFHKLGSAFWPGPLTLIVRASPAIPPAVTAQTGYVGIRVPKHDLAQTLLRAAQLPVAAPSANRFGHVSPTRAAHVLADLGDKGVMVLDGEAAGREEAPSCVHGIESTVLKIDGERQRLRVFRQGAISVLQLEALLEHDWEIEVYQRHIKMEGVQQESSQSPLELSEREQEVGQEAPGQAITHYAPDVPCYLVTACTKTLEQQDEGLKQVSEMEKVLSLTRAELCTTVVLDFGGMMSSNGIPADALAYRELSEKGSACEGAAQLFDALRWAELRKGATTVLIGCPPESTQNEALQAGLVDRMNRAASGKKVVLNVNF
jgi:L-threonylcarbamoyladenylate synthase